MLFETLVIFLFLLIVVSVVAGVSAYFIYKTARGLKKTSIVQKIGYKRFRTVLIVVAVFFAALPVIANFLYPPDVDFDISVSVMRFSYSYVVCLIWFFFIGIAFDLHRLLCRFVIHQKDKKKRRRARKAAKRQRSNSYPLASFPLSPTAGHHTEEKEAGVKNKRWRTKRILRRWLLLKGDYRFFVVLMTAVMVLLCSGIYEATLLHVRDVTLVSSSLPSSYNTPLRIAIISDTHYGATAGWRSATRIVNAVRKNNVDVLLSVGDFLDKLGPGLDEVIDIFARESYPLGKYAILGNHEAIAGVNGSIKALQDCGFTVLDSDAVELVEGIVLGGISDQGDEFEEGEGTGTAGVHGIEVLAPETVGEATRAYIEKLASQLMKHFMDPSEIEDIIGSLLDIGDEEGIEQGARPSYVRNLGEGPVAILMKHEPLPEEHISFFGDLVSKSDQRPADIILSGHTHAGQIFPFHIIVRLAYPFFHGLYAVSNSLKPIQLDDSKQATLGQDSFIYTLSGSGTWGPPLRNLAIPELLILTLKRA